MPPEAAEIEESPSDDPGAESPSADVEPEEQAAGESPSPDDEPSGDDDVPESYRNWLEKYGGDKGKAGEHAWRATQDNARFSKENQELRARLERSEAQNEALTLAMRGEKGKPDTDEAETVPELEEYESHIQSLEEREQELGEDYKGVLSAYDDARVDIRLAERQIDAIERRLKGSDEIDQDGLRDQLQRWREGKAAAERNKTEAERGIRRIRREAKDLQFQLTRARKDRDSAKEYLQRQREEEESVAAQGQQQREDYQTFVGDVVAEAAKAHGIPEAKLERVRRVVEGQLSLRLMTLPPEPLDPALYREKHGGWIREYVKDYAEDYGFSKKQEFRESSERKLDKTRPQRKPTGNGKHVAGTELGRETTDGMARARERLRQGMLGKLGL